jgi:hypothetical protein
MPVVTRDSLAHHRAAREHEEAARIHELAALVWEERGVGELATLEHRFARTELDAARLQRARARSGGTPYSGDAA